MSAEGKNRQYSIDRAGNIWNQIHIVIFVCIYSETCL